MRRLARLLILGCGLWLTPAWAASITPVLASAGSPFTHFPGDLSFVEGNAVGVPGNTVAIAGWVGWFTTRGTQGYIRVEVWHDGGTPHMLQQSFWGLGPSETETYQVADIPAVLLPSPGHQSDGNDKYFIRVYCVSFEGPLTCQSAVTFYLRVP